MSIGLKVQSADEIVEAMIKTLGEDFVKEAAGPALEAYKSDLASAADENGLINAWNKHMDALNQEESTNEALKLQAEKASELGIPGYTSPADDKKCCPECGKELPEELPAGGEEIEEMAWDAKTNIAAQFAMKQLSKISNSLDNNGFNIVADIVDEALNKIASKKK